MVKDNAIAYYKKFPYMVPGSSVEFLCSDDLFIDIYRQGVLPSIVFGVIPLYSAYYRSEEALQLCPCSHNKAQKNLLYHRAVASKSITTMMVKFKKKIKSVAYSSQGNHTGQLNFCN